jgi:uncharacterized protein YaiL (DUF2058 family)
VSKSLQDQLLSLGLAREPSKKNTRQSAPARKKTRPGNRSADKSSVHPGTAKDDSVGEDISLEQAYRIRESQEQSEKQQKRAKKMEEDRKRAALNKAILEIVEAGRLNVADAGEARYFMYKERIRKIYLTPEQLSAVNQGTLGVVYLRGGYHLLSSENIETVRKLSPDHVPDLGSGEDDEQDLWSGEEESQSS